MMALYIAFSLSVLALLLVFPTWPSGMRVPNPAYFKKFLNLKELEEEPVNWREWEKKYPGLVKHAEKEIELPLCNNGFGFSGLEASRKSSVHWLPVPMHLRSIDSGEPKIPEFDFDDYQIGFDYGIKPEIHVKYREPPFNDPNWRDWTWKGPIKFKREKGKYVRVEEEAEK